MLKLIVNMRMFIMQCTTGFLFPVSDSRFPMTKLTQSRIQAELPVLTVLAGV